MNIITEVSSCNGEYIKNNNKYKKITSKLYISNNCKETKDVFKVCNNCSNEYKINDTCEHLVYMNKRYISMKKTNIYSIISQHIKYKNIKIKHTYLSHFLENNVIPDDYHVDNDGYVYYKKENIEYIDYQEYTIIQDVKISTICKESSPCQHDVFINNERKLMSSVDIYKLLVDLIKNKNIKIKESYLNHFIDSINNRLYRCNKKWITNPEQIRINVDYFVDDNGYVYYL
jgi:hypothetical protein